MPSEMHLVGHLRSHYESVSYSRIARLNTKQACEQIHEFTRYRERGQGRLKSRLRAELPAPQETKEGVLSSGWA
jgi:hypothetical protein